MTWYFKLSVHKWSDLHRNVTSIYWLLNILHFPAQEVNSAMQKDVCELTIGVLDIYGFEIFEV